MSPVELLAGIDAQPRFCHDHLRASVGSDSLPVEYPADSSLRSEYSPISSLAVGASRGAEGQFLLSHRTAEQ
jgi:hypothetical protein